MLRYDGGWQRLIGQSQSKKGAISVSMDGRFMVKLALGVGYQLFLSDFLATSYAKELRRVLGTASSSIHELLTLIKIIVKRTVCI